LVAGFGLLALLPTVPLSGLLSYKVSEAMSQSLNFKLQGFRIPPQTLLQQTALALGVPLAAAVFPVISGTRLTIRQALATYGLGQGRFGKSRVDRWVEKIRFLSRPMLISLRNTFRRKTRLVLTLITLTLGGASFIAVLNLRTAVFNMLDSIQGYFMADVNFYFARDYRLDKLKALAQTAPGVAGLEGWGYSNGQLLSSDKKTAIEVGFVAPPADSKLIRPIVLEGRWLTPQDENAIVIGPHLLKVRPDLKVGDTVVIKINNKETTWRIVGRYQMGGNENQPPIYANYEYLSQQTGQVGRVGSLRVITTAHDAAAQKDVKNTLEAIFKQAGMEVSSSSTGAEWKQGQVAQFDVLINFMMTMALMVAVVGALGLAGTMSMNILERIREIGVMRAIGASSAAIFRLVMMEGLLIGLISWGLAFAVAIPITLVLNQSVGVAVLTVAMDFAFGWEGITFWLAVVVLLSAVSSLLPAWNATRLTVREVLAYE
jgi:putative ABC transport system permease protein